MSATVDSAPPEEHVRALVERARRFDGDAWDELYTDAYPRLFGYCRRRSASDQDADEVVAEVLSRAVAGIEQFVWGETQFIGWLFGICHNVLRESWRRTERDRARVVRVAGLADPAPSEPSDAIVDDEQYTEVRAAFAKLSSEDRDVLELRIVAGLGATAVGAILDCSAGAVRMAQSRALGRLRALLNASGGA